MRPNSVGQGNDQSASTLAPEQESRADRAVWLGQRGRHVFGPLRVSLRNTVSNCGLIGSEWLAAEARRQ